ncbi:MULTISPECIES: CBM35 domain-containing protein [unclassified Streptomyces]|uniref:CBM35 domain-containing protein n=1 Tax=unclassified Streptomyces TaxID=2593676 RepID=UPI0037213037
MTAGNNGANKPEDDDPFGYLYEDGQAAGAQPPRQGGYGYPGPAAPQPGVPRTSYNQVRTVGERQYGQQVPQQQPYGQQQAYNQPNAQYAAPETYPGATGQVPQQGGRGRSGGSSGSGGPNTKGLLIAAVAVVLVVLIGIGAALITGDKDKDKKKDEATSSAGPGNQVEESPKPEQSPSSEDPADLPEQDAATLKLGGPAVVSQSVKGADGPNGSYVTGFNEVGASVTWKAAMKEAGKYRLTVRYAIPAKDANATLTVNGKPNSQPIGLKNFIDSSDPNWEKNWQTTWAPVDLVKGENEVSISCQDGNQCDVILDWLKVTPANGAH